MNRRARPTVSNAVTAAYRGRLIEGNREVGYKLTTLGYGRALGLVKEVTMSLGQGNI